MGVTILGMPMPRGCGECWLTYADYDSDDCPVDKCVLTGKIVWNDTNERAEDCMLMETDNDSV